MLLAPRRRASASRGRRSATRRASSRVRLGRPRPRRPSSGRPLADQEARATRRRSPSSGPRSQALRTAAAEAGAEDSEALLARVARDDPGERGAPGAADRRRASRAWTSGRKRSGATTSRASARGLSRTSTARTASRSRAPRSSWATCSRPRTTRGRNPMRSSRRLLLVLSVLASAPLPRARARRRPAERDSSSSRPARPGGRQVSRPSAGIVLGGARRLAAATTCPGSAPSSSSPRARCRAPAASWCGQPGSCAPGAVIQSSSRHDRGPRPPRRLRAQARLPTAGGSASRSERRRASSRPEIRPGGSRSARGRRSAALQHARPEAPARARCGDRELRAARARRSSVPCSPPVPPAPVRLSAPAAPLRRAAVRAPAPPAGHPAAPAPPPWRFWFEPQGSARRARPRPGGERRARRRRRRPRGARPGLMSGLGPDEHVAVAVDFVAGGPFGAGAVRATLVVRARRKRPRRARAREALARGAAQAGGDRRVLSVSAASGAAPGCRAPASVGGREEQERRGRALR